MALTLAFVVVAFAVVWLTITSGLAFILLKWLEDWFFGID